jgi:hypothetical protein
MLSDSHSYFSAALSGEGSRAAVLAGLPVALAGAICVTRKFRCATDVTTPPPPARRRHSPAGEASASLCQIRSPRGFGSSCVLCRSIGPPPRSLARGGRIRIRSARLQKARGLDTCACSHVSSSEFPTQPVVERGRIDYICIPCSTTVRSTLHRLIRYSVRFDRPVRFRYGSCTVSAARRRRRRPRGYHASSVSSRPPFARPPFARRPRRSPGGAGPPARARARGHLQSRGGSLVHAGAPGLSGRYLRPSLRRLRAPPAGSGTGAAARRGPRIAIANSQPTAPGRGAIADPARPRAALEPSTKNGRVPFTQVVFYGTYSPWG